MYRRSRRRLCTGDVHVYKEVCICTGGGGGGGGGEEMWSLDKMQAYICHVKTLKPVLTEAATRLGHVTSSCRSIIL